MSLRKLQFKNIIIKEKNIQLAGKIILKVTEIILKMYIEEQRRIKQFFALQTTEEIYPLGIEEIHLFDHI